jgi:hypothetical protein
MVDPHLHGPTAVGTARSQPQRARRGAVILLLTMAAATLLAGCADTTFSFATGNPGAYWRSDTFRIYDDPSRGR